MGHKIDELNNTVTPVKEEALKSKEDLVKMETELIKNDDKRKNLELMYFFISKQIFFKFFNSNKSINELKSNLAVKQKDYRHSMEELKISRQIGNAMIYDINDAVAYIQNPKMIKKKLLNLYRNYVEKNIYSIADKKNLKKEESSQRNFLESTVIKLATKCKDNSNKCKETTRKMLKV